MNHLLLWLQQRWPVSRGLTSGSDRALQRGQRRTYSYLERKGVTFASILSLSLFLYGYCFSLVTSRSCRECWNERFFSPVPQIFNTSAGKAFVLLSYVFLSLVIHNLRHTGAPCDSSPYHDSAGLKYSVFAVLATWCSARRRVKLRTRCRVKRKWESTSWAPRRQLCLPLPSWHSH